MIPTVLFRGQKTKKEVHAWGIHKQMFVVTGVATTEYEMGVFVQLFEDEQSEKPATSRLWGLVTPRDFLTFWRATLILDRLPVLNEGSLCYSYYAAQRDPHESEHEKVEEITENIGEPALLEIMRTPIPDFVISTIVKLHDADEGVSLWPITEEVKAGTLSWQPKFAEMGIKHPDEVARREKAETTVIAGFELLLMAYGAQHNLPRKCMGMSQIEGGVIQAVEKGIHEKYGIDIVLGIAITLSHAASTAFVEAIGFGSGSNNAVDIAIQEGIEDATKFLQEVFSHPINKYLQFWKVPDRSDQEYQDILSKLAKEFETLPITNPL